MLINTINKTFWCYFCKNSTKNKLLIVRKHTVDLKHTYYEQDVMKLSTK